MTTQLNHHIFRLELKNTFTISHGSYDFRDTMIVSLEKEGITGLGEATVIPYLGVSVDKLENSIQKIVPLIKNLKWSQPSELWEQLSPHLEDDCFLLSAIDSAAWDWYGKKQNKPVWDLLGAVPENAPLSSYTIGKDSPEIMALKMDSTPWPVYKIKIASGADMDLIRKLRQTNDSIFRIDANCSWKVDEVYSLYAGLKELNVDLLEQPLPIGQDFHLKKELHDPSIPVFADESCSALADIEKLAPYYDGINIKLMKCGGITPALEMIKEAKAQGVQIMGGCMTESSVGISAMAQLAPFFDYLDLDGALLLSNDPAEGIKVKMGKVILSDAPGLGCRLK